MQEYNIIVIGGGPAGLTSAIYARRGGASVAVVEGASFGGQMVTTDVVYNYPAMYGKSGFEIAEAMLTQAMELGAELISGSVESVDTKAKIVHGDFGDAKYQFLVIASGASPRKLALAREDELTGHGVHYCATCDGGFYKGKVVAIVGGGNTALAEAKYLAKLAKKVYVIHRRNEFRASKAEVMEIERLPNIELIMDAQVIELLGKPLSSIILSYNNGVKKELVLDGLFVAVGQTPRTNFIENITLNHDYIVTDDHMRTNISGVYAVGDVRDTALRQIVTACSDGAIAVENILKEI